MTATPDYFTDIKNRFLEAWGLANANVTRHAIAYGSRDAWNGHRAVTFANSTVEMIVIPKGTITLSLIPGFYPKYDAVGITNATWTIGDLLTDAASRIFQVRTIEHMKYPGSSTSIYQKCDLSLMHIYEAQFGSTTWTLTRGSDARYRAKVFIDTYARVAQITKDNDSTQATWAAIFNNPPYPLSAEFRAGSSPVQGLYVIDKVNSDPIIGVDNTARGYVEHTPVHVCTVNSTACSGEALLHKMTDELRYICKTYPFGSLRLMEHEEPQDRDLDGMWLYDRVFTMKYYRDTTT